MKQPVSQAHQVNNPHIFFVPERDSALYMRRAFRLYDDVVDIPGASNAIKMNY